MGNFGSKLKHERENRGFELDEIASATKINARYLQALEEDDFERLPTEVFAKGFIRAYAQHIGADAGYLIEQYEIERGGGEGGAQPADGQEVIREMSRILAEQGESPGTHRRRIAAWGVAAVAVVVAAVWLSLHRGAGEAAPVSERVPPRVAAASVGEPPREREAPVPEPVAVAGVAEIEPTAAPDPTPPTAVDAPEPEREAVIEEPAPVARIEPEPAPRVEAAASVKPSPEPLDESGPATPTPVAGAARITIPDHDVGTGVEDRQLVGVTDRFTEGQQVWYWTRVVGANPGETIRHVWLREGREVDTVDLRIGSSHWRTQSRKTMRPGSAGSWAVEARDAQGHVLARREFVCLSPS